MMLLLTGLAAHAATYDPELKWRTLSTEHFDIHFHQGVEQVADELSTEVEQIYDTMTSEVRWEPRPRIQVVLVDRTDSANGFATAIPYPSITIYVTAPTEGSTLNLYEQWNEAIFTHELTHVLHMDTNHGIVRAARLLFGRVASTNSVSPLWTIEGFATFEETRYTDGGRGRASWPDMMKRTAVVEDDFPPLGNLDGFQPRPPGGNLRYLWGQDFIQYISDHQGPQVFTRWVHTYGGWVPFWLPSKRAFGESLWSLYKDWRAAEFAHYTAQAEAVRAEGETSGRIVSDPEASCGAPAFSPDGDKLVWSCYDLRTGSAIWMSDGDGFGPEKLLENNGAGYFTWRADSKAFVFAAVHLVNQFNAWSDIYLYPLGGAPTALTSGARARDPDFSPDGTELLYVTNAAQNNQLEIMTVDRRRQPLTKNTDHTQYSTPRYSPDGERVALSVWKDGQRDLWLYDRKGQPVRRLTMDAAIDADPMWSADGKWLYFDSDRTGIPNVYAIELETERLWQVTNVVTGAVKPSIHPSGKRMAYMQYSQDGFDVHVMDLDPAQYRDRGLLPQPVSYGAPIAPAEPAKTDPTAASRVPDDPGGGSSDHGGAPGSSVAGRSSVPGLSLVPGPSSVQGLSLVPVPSSIPSRAGELGGHGAALTAWESPVDAPGPGSARPRAGLFAGRAGSAFTGIGRVPGIGPAAFGVPDPIAAPPPTHHVPGSDLVPERVARQSEVLDNFGDIDVEDAFGEEKEYPFRITPHRYNPASSLLPRYVLPYFQLTPYRPGPTFDGTCGVPDPTSARHGPQGTLGFCRGIQGTLSTGASDALARYGWGAALSYRTDAEYLGAGFGLTINRFLPVYSFGVSTQAVVTGELAYVNQQTPTLEDGSLSLYETEPPSFYWEKRTSAYATVSWPYKLRSALFAQYSFTDRRPRWAIPQDVYLPSVPFMGFVGALSGGYRYSWSEPTMYAISPEDGRLFAFVGSLRHPLLGSFSRDPESEELEPFSQLQLTTELREYWANPWLANHVLAVRGAAGVTLGTSDYFGNYLLGGSIGDTGILATPDEFRMVRGYPYAFDIGDMYWLAEAEYRLPLLRIERGVRTLPAYARTFSGAVFADVANAFNDPALETGVPPTAAEVLQAAGEHPMVGVGAEITFRTVVGWGVGLSGRLGYAVGLTEGGYKPDQGLAPMYLQLGGSF